MKVAEHPSAMADEFEQPASRMVILTVFPEVIGDLVDTVRQDCYLDLCRARIAIVPLVGLDNLRLLPLLQLLLHLLLIV